MYFLVDYENMTGHHPFDGVEFLSENDTLVIFFSQTAATIRYGDLSKIEKSNCKVRLIKLVQQRKNGLDFYIASFVGKIFGDSQSSEEAVIITGDTGLSAVSDFWKSFGGNKYSVIVSKNIADAICQSKTDSDIKNQAREYNNRVNIEFEISRINQKRKLKNSFLALLTGTGFEDRIDEILLTFENSKNSRNRYNEFLKAFGRAAGGEIYNFIKCKYASK